jgi:hypothetical protein
MMGSFDPCDLVGQPVPSLRKCLLLSREVRRPQLTTPTLQQRLQLDVHGRSSNDSSP